MMTPEQREILEGFAEKISKNMVDSEPAFSKVVDDHFWELFDDDLQRPR